MVIGRGSDVFIIDTKEGHCWGYNANNHRLRYHGQFRPGDEYGEVINEPEEKTIDELRQEMEALKSAIEQGEKAIVEEEAEEEEASVADSRTELQRAIARANLKRELKAEILKVIEEEELSEEQKNELRRIIEGIE
jgi:hypothetical protein